MEGVEVRLERLKLSNYRNFDNIDLAFPHRANLFFGPNGAGKTNLLESINYLSVAKSHRGGRDREVIRFGQESFRIEGMGEKEQRQIKIEISFKAQEKRICLNSNQLSVSELVGNLPVVPLSSDDIETTRGTPLLRRRFVDMILSFLKPSYFAGLMSYRRVLQQRNRILADARTFNRNCESIEAWNMQLIQFGSELIRSRMKFAGEFSRLASKYYGAMAPEGEAYELTYHPSVPLEGPSIEDSFADQLEKSKDLEKERGATLVGPHRDDFVQKLSGRDMRRFASEGEQRTASISMKLAGAELVREGTGEWPIVMFDEVFAELDRERVERVGKAIDNLGQVFIATAKAN
ncbi:MAG: DNA replication/repair protein RecF, partial [bacterium]